MEILYALTIHPIEIFYRYAYIFCLHLIGGHVPALLCLAILSTIIFTPLKRIANAIQDREKHIQRVIGPQIDKIKQSSAGGERYARIAALYKRYAYHPVFAFRSTMGLFLQVPFLFGAYAMISTFVPLQGQSFWRITDLSRPDGLLAGINVLPFLMTAFNVIAAYATKGLSRREHLQSLAIALFFLVILYTAPAALLIYWTANNFFLMLQTVGERYIILVSARFRSGKKLRLKAPSKSRLATFLGSARTIFNKQDGPVYTSCAAALGITLIGVCPVAFFTSSPDVFEATYASLMLSLLPGMTVWVLAATLIWLSTPKNFRAFLALLTVLATLIVLCNAFVFVRDFGVMDGHRFVSREAFGKSFANKMQDIAIFLLAVTVVYVQHRFKLTRHLVTSLRVASLGMVLFCALAPVFLLSSEERSQAAPIAAAPALPANNARVFGFSKTGPNVLVIIPDMMTGEHMQPLVADNEAMRRHFTGFTWYRDTVAGGDNTLLGIAGIYGGHAFETHKMSEMEGLSKPERILKSMAVMPNELSPKGFDSVLITCALRLDTSKLTSFVNDKDSFLFISRLDYAYDRLWNEKLGIKEKAAKDNPATFLLAVSLFRISPFTFKRDIYGRGTWLGTTGVIASDSITRTLRDAAKIGVLPDVISAESSRPTLKFLYTGLTHGPWSLSRDSLIPTPQPIPDSEGQNLVKDGRFVLHMYAERHLLNMLTDLFVRMRELGVYDNTLIIVASDHGIGDSASMRRAFSGSPEELAYFMTHEKKNYPGHPDTLLLVKEIGADHPFAIFDREMQNSDVPSIICAATGGCESIAPLPPEGQRRVRLHHVGDPRIENHPADLFKTDVYRVTGPMHKKESWQGPEHDAQ